MAIRPIYAWNEGEYDHSRWLELTVLASGSVEFVLSELCQPGCASALPSICLSRQIVESALRNGAVQVSTSTGYFLLRRRDEIMVVEFRGVHDSGPCKASVLVNDLLPRLENSESDSVCLTA
jgi:hypothetical protein